MTRRTFSALLLTLRLASIARIPGSDGGVPSAEMLLEKGHSNS